MQFLLQVVSIDRQLRYQPFNPTTKNLSYFLSNTFKVIFFETVENGIFENNCVYSMFIVLIGYVNEYLSKLMITQRPTFPIQFVSKYNIPYRTKFRPNFRRTKYFVGQNLRQQAEISTILSDEFMSNKVIPILLYNFPNDGDGSGTIK